MAAGERTEAATPRRLEELRSRGSLPRSQDLNTAILLVAGFVMLHQFGGEMVGRMRWMLGSYFSLAANFELSERTVPQLAGTTVILLLGLLAPVLVVMPAVGVASSLGQVGVVFATRAASPDFSRVNPFTGLKRLFALRSLVDLLKVLAKAGVLALVIGKVYTDNMPEMIALGSTDLMLAAPRFGTMAMDIGLRVSAALLVLGVADYGYQRWEFQRSTRMTKEELRLEMRETEGRPEVRARIRQRQRKLASGRMMAMVAKADVIITNPTHLAVALAYKPGDMNAPRVLAKGAGFVAQRIKARAQQHGIPLVENKPLARALFGSVDVGKEIPLTLFQAVAEVLAFVYSLRDRNRSLGPVAHHD